MPAQAWTGQQRDLSGERKKAPKIGGQERYAARGMVCVSKRNGRCPMRGGMNGRTAIKCDGCSRIPCPLMHCSG